MSNNILINSNSNYLIYEKSLISEIFARRLMNRTFLNLSEKMQLINSKKIVALNYWLKKF